MYPSRYPIFGFQSTLPRRERRQDSKNSRDAFDFNPRSREGSDHFLQLHTLQPCNFNPRSREGSDILAFLFCGNGWDFNPRSREGSDKSNRRFTTNTKNFNPRSREGSDKSRQRIGQDQQNFNPRSREGSDQAQIAQCCCDIKISIHAPAKGATAIFHKIINLYCKTSTNTTRINSLNINKKYINRIKARILNYFFGANHLINLCKLYIRTCNL